VSEEVCRPETMSGEGVRVCERVCEGVCVSVCLFMYLIEKSCVVILCGNVLALKKS
jgi:hypothetical protein